MRSKDVSMWHMWIFGCTLHPLPLSDLSRPPLFHLSCKSALNVKICNILALWPVVMSLCKICAWYLLEDYVHIHECVLYVEVFPSNTGHQFPGVQCSTQNTRSDHCQCVCSGFFTFKNFLTLCTVCWVLRPLSYIWTSFQNDHTWMCTVSIVWCCAQVLCSAKSS